MKVTVMGTGSWGTTFAIVLADAGADVTMWGRRASVCQEIRESHTNRGYLHDTRIPSSVDATDDAERALEDARIVVLAVPSQTLRRNLEAWSGLWADDAALVSLMKGVELGTNMRMSEVICEAAKADPDRVVVVSGPNLAREIAARQPTATVVACRSMETAELVAEACSAPYFRPYTQTDVVGVELGGAVKNVIALTVGIADGMGFGDNTKASIITRGLAETARLAAALGAEPSTMAGLAGMGDLVATCASPLSRNRSFGALLGGGMSVGEARATAKQTAEAITSCGPILDLARQHGVDMPLTELVVAVLHGGLPVDQLAPKILGRPRKAEDA